jgi:hypothetical protein
MKIFYLSVILFFVATSGLCATRGIEGTEEEFEKAFAAFSASLPTPPEESLPHGTRRDYVAPSVKDCLSIVFNFKTSNITQFGIKNIKIFCGRFMTKGSQLTFNPSPISVSGDSISTLEGHDRYVQSSLPVSLINLISQMDVSLRYRLKDEDFEREIQKTFSFLEDPKPEITFMRRKKGHNVRGILNGCVGNVAQIWVELLDKKGGGLKMVQLPSIRNEEGPIATDANSSYQEPKRVEVKKSRHHRKKK